MKQSNNCKSSKEDKYPPLYQALILDAIGCLTYLIPIAEWVDVVWAPISAWMFIRLFGGKVGTFGAIVNFTEEILPFSDFFPTFTIGWIIRRCGIS